MDDCRSGKYIAYVYHKEWFLGIILITSEKNQCVGAHWWTLEEDPCAAARGYYLFEKEFGNILKLIENFSV